MDYNDMYLKKRQQRMENILTYLTATVGYLLNFTKTNITPPAGGNGSIVFRDAPSDPEAAPTPATINAVLIFRNGAPTKYWDSANSIWI